MDSRPHLSIVALTSAQREHIDRQCDLFEAAWRSESPPSIETFLAESPESLRTALLRELLFLEFAYQAQQQQRQADVGEYTARFPEHTDIVEDVHRQCRRMLDTALLGDASTLSFVGREPSPPNAAGDTMVGQQFGDYLILSKIAEGGMGVVFEARQLQANRAVALKMIRSGELAGDEEIERFHREAEAAANLDHPNIVPIFEVGERNGRHFFSMGLVQGESLKEKLHDGPLAPDQAAALLRTIALAVAHAHAHGIIHRDLKPHNVLIDLEGRPRVTDFGLAKRIDSNADGDSGMTATGQIMGTPNYMSPEQASGRTDQVNKLSDIYSLGAVFYEMLTGHPPFQASGVVDILEQVLNQDPSPPARANPALNKDLETICLKCLEKEPTNRYLSAEELADDLGRYERNEPIKARPIRVVSRAWRWIRRHPTRTAAIALGVLALAASTGMAVAIQYQDRLQSAYGQLESTNGELESSNVQLKASLENEASARQDAEVAKDQAERLQRQIDQMLSTRRINLAMAEWTSSHPTRARELLLECPPAHRHWEWRYVARVCQQAEWSLQADEKAVRGIACSPDGRHLLTVSVSDEVRIWDSATRQEVRRLKGHAEMVNTAAYSFDGKKIVTASMDKTVKVWDAESGAELASLEDSHLPVMSAAFSPNGELIVAGGMDRMIRVWDVASGELTELISGHSKMVKSVGFLSEGKRILSTSYDRTAAIWDSGTDKRLVFEGTHPASNAALSPLRKRLVAAGNDNDVLVWDTNDGELLHRLRGHAGTVSAVASSPNENLLASASVDRTVKVWLAGNGQLEQTLFGHEAAVDSVAFSPDSLHIYSGDANGVLKCWNAKKHPSVNLGGAGQVIRRVSKSASRLRCAAFSPTTPLVATGGEGVIELWDTSSGRLVDSMPAEVREGHPAIVTNIAFSRDGQWLVAANRLWVLKSQTGDQADVLTGDWIQVWDVERRKPLLSMETEGKVQCVAISPDGRHIAGLVGQVGTLAGARISVWDTHSGQLLHTHPRNAQDIESIDYSPDGRLLSAGGRQVNVWDAITGEQVFTGTGHTATVERVAFAPDSSRLFSTGKESILWDMGTGEQIASIPAAEAVFSPDGERLAQAISSGSLTLWDAATGQEVFMIEDPYTTLSGATYPTIASAFSPDGTRLLACNSVGEIFIWDARPIQ